MKGTQLNIIPAICLLAISIAGCNSNNNKQDKQVQVATAHDAPVIRNDELYPFMLAGVYFVHGYGGPEQAFNTLIQPAVKGEPGSDDFSRSIQAAYSRYFIFPFKPEEKDGEEEAKGTLADYWDIHNTAELEKSLNWLLEEGHQAQYAKYRKVLEENGGAGADLTAIDLSKYSLSKTDIPGMQFIKDHYAEFSKAGIRAWDIARYINNICIAYQAGYFNRGQANFWLKKAPQVVQSEYSDWNTYFNDFLLGREFWGGGETDKDRFKKEVAGMLEGKYSLYTYLPIK